MSNYILVQLNYTDIYYDYKSNNLKWISSSFRLNLVFPILMAQMIFSQIQQALTSER